MIRQHRQASIDFQDKGNDFHVRVQAANNVIGLNETENHVRPKRQLPGEKTLAGKGSTSSKRNVVSCCIHTAIPAVRVKTNMLKPRPREQLVVHGVLQSPTSTTQTANFLTLLRHSLVQSKPLKSTFLEGYSSSGCSLVTFPFKGDDPKSAATKNAASLLLISVFSCSFSHLIVET